MTFSLIKAAEESGKSKSTIHRAIKSGKLSAERNEDGSYSIDPSELARVFPAVRSGTPQKGVMEPPPEPYIIKELEARLEAAKDRLDDAHNRLAEKDDIITDLKSDRNMWRQQATQLLEDHRQDTSVPARGFLQRLFGKR